MVTDSSGPNGSFIDRNFHRGRTQHGEGTNMVFFDGHAANRRWDEAPYMFVPWANLNAATFQYYGADPDPLWRPWYDQFPITNYLDMQNQ